MFFKRVRLDPEHIIASTNREDTGNQAGQSFPHSMASISQRLLQLIPQIVLPHSLCLPAHHGQEEDPCGFVTHLEAQVPGRG
ncbi:hypothetical protein COCON_G00065010 [Conger conger]|uniref:Uncharacterized protein n=1 Tax=Conger conger TaxID=82655 RepID=A0A9Q1DS29_CONCO|nr:hypothetical protein COCON_G00065010 [Conger conger]